MKINRTTLTLIVASLCGVGPTVAFGQDALSEAARSSAGRIGDAVGAPKAQSGASQSISDAGEVKAPAMRSPSDRAVAGAYPVATARPNGAGMVRGGSDCTSPGCTTPGCDSAGCDARGSVGLGGNGGKLFGAHRLGRSGGCDSGSCSGSGSCDSAGLLSGFGGACGLGGAGLGGVGSGLGWAESDTLLWWGRGLTNSPVIVGGNSPTVLPTNPLLGGYDNPLGNDMLVGLRGNVGFWLDDCQNYGVGGRAWGLISDGNEQVITNGGNSTGISFYNTSLGQPDTYIVNLDRGPFGKNVGEIGVLNDLDVYSGDLYLRALLLGNRCNRVDLLGGYTFLRLDSGYQLRSRIVDGWTDAPPPVTTVTTIVDRFSTKNEFHGGHVGLQSNITRGRFGMGLMGKVAMGNMT
ncbi:MAG: BBP7 family outer membrane beta-barrel protein, partial [Pirellula sp.]